MSASLSSGLASAETTNAAAGSVTNLVRALTSDRMAQVHSGGPTIADLVREEIRPVIKSWLDSNLPPLVERLVRAEIERGKSVLSGELIFGDHIAEDLTTYLREAEEQKIDLGQLADEAKRLIGLLPEAEIRNCEKVILELKAQGKGAAAAEWRINTDRKIALLHDIKLDRLPR